uniref:Uncharacterized protein n=1 Tax=Manihot esculenta TaxID=3983 RepID=A0A2C9UMM6_MANES
MRTRSRSATVKDSAASIRSLELRICGCISKCASLPRNVMVFEHRLLIF